MATSPERDSSRSEGSEEDTSLDAPTSPEDIEELGQDSEQSRIQLLRAQEFSGPLPPPSVLQGYNDIVPDAAERILSMAEREQAHRHDHDSQFVQLLARGQWFGFILGIAALGVGTYLLAIGVNVGGLVSLILGLGPIIAAFLFRRSVPEPPGEAPE